MRRGTEIFGEIEKNTQQPAAVCNVPIFDSVPNNPWCTNVHLVSTTIPPFARTRPHERLRAAVQKFTRLIMSVEDVV